MSHKFDFNEIPCIIIHILIFHYKNAINCLFEKGTMGKHIFLLFSFQNCNWVVSHENMPTDFCYSIIPIWESDNSK